MHYWIGCYAKRLHDVRKNRLVTIKENENINYTKIEKIEIELTSQKHFKNTNGQPSMFQENLLKKQLHQ